MNDPRFSGASRNPVTDHLDLWASALLVRSTAGRGSNGRLEAYGIRKLRALILELAVLGKLVPQNAGDEPASVLLGRIEKEKKRLDKEGPLARQSSLPEVTNDDVNFSLPSGWLWSRLGELTNYGVTDKAEPEDADADTWVLDLEDVEKETSKLLQKIRFSEKPFRSAKNRFAKGDVIYGKLRPYLDKVLVADEGGVCTTEMMPVRGYAGIYPFYLRLVMKAPHFIRYADDSTHGMNLPRLGTDKARMALFPLAPLAEQHRIVAKVDELMALCDQLERQQGCGIEAHQTLVETMLGTLTSVESAQEFAVAWNRIAEHFDALFTTEHSIDQIKQTILQLAVMGKLVPQNPKAEPASVLLDEIAKRRKELVAKGVLKRQASFPAITKGEALFALPPSWEFVRFGDVTFNRDAERVPLSVDERSGRRGQYDYYGASGIIDSIDGYLFDKPLLLIGEDGANLINRSTPIAFMARGKYWVNNHAHVIDGLSESLLLYICLHINAISLEPYVTGTAQPKMNQAKMNAIVLAFPPKEEQHRIVAKVDELMALCDALKACLAEAQTTQIHLANAIVERAVAAPQEAVA